MRNKQFWGRIGFFTLILICGFVLGNGIARLIKGQYLEGSGMVLSVVSMAFFLMRSTRRGALNSSCQKNIKSMKA